VVSPLGSLPELRLDAAAADTLRGLRGRLRSLGYTDEGVRAVLATPAGVENTERLEALRESSPGPRQPRRQFESAAEALTHLFLLEGTLPMSQVRGLLGRRPTAALLDAGLLNAEGSRVSADVLLLPWKGLWLLTDAHAHRLARDAVFIPDASTYALSALLPPAGGRRAVDVGTGCGLLALQQAESFEAVTALDVNPRAVAFARFNAAVNRRALVVERCDADPFRSAPVTLGDADVITFVMPFVCSDFDGAESIALAAADGPALLEATYRGVEATLGERGAALLWHQVPRRPAEGFARALEGWGIVPRNHVLLDLAAMSDDLDLGAAVVRRGPHDTRAPIVRIDRNATGRPTLAELDRASRALGQLAARPISPRETPVPAGTVSAGPAARHLSLEENHGNREMAGKGNGRRRRRAPHGTAVESRLRDRQGRADLRRHPGERGPGVPA
jgi:SAM-dependent methyltransferase